MNEELRVVNEELQAANEELHTQSEELHLQAEELRTQRDTQQQLADTLAGERARFETVLQQMPAGITIAEAPSGNDPLNEQMHRIFETRPPHTKRQALPEWEMFHGDARHLMAAVEPRSSGRPRRAASRHRTGDLESDGPRRVMSVNAAPGTRCRGRIIAVAIH